MKKVVATGTFDIIHPGHIRFLEEARKYGDYLIVIVARERNVKHKPKPVIPEEQRLRVVRALKPVDEAILGDEDDIFRPIERIRPDVIVLGYDQHFDEEWLKAELEKRGIEAEIVRVNARESCDLCSSARIVERIISLVPDRTERKEQT